MCLIDLKYKLCLDVRGFVAGVFTEHLIF